MHCVRFMQRRTQRLIQTLNPNKTKTFLILFNHNQHERNQNILLRAPGWPNVIVWWWKPHWKTIEIPTNECAAKAWIEISNILKSFWLNHHRNTIDSCVKFFSNLYAVQSAAFILSNGEFPLYCTRLYAPHACFKHVHTQGESIFVQKCEICISYLCILSNPCTINPFNSSTYLVYSIYNINCIVIWKIN